MKSTKLTTEILNKLKPTDIIYAEFAEGGAMGACGTARIFTLRQNKLIFYLVRADDSKSAESTWVAVYERLHNLADQGELDEEYAGFGNIAWKQPEIIFARNDDTSSFVYKKGNKEYQIPTSVEGVYRCLIACFAKREVSLEELKKHLSCIASNLTDEEFLFYCKYLEQCHRADSGTGWFDFTIEDYMGAVAYIRHLDGTEYILNPEDRNDCCAALQKYRLKYIVEKTSWDELNKFFASFASSNKTALFLELEALIGEPVIELFTEMKTIKSSCTALDDESNHNITALFAYRPVLVDFPEEAHAKIIAKILELKPFSLRLNAGSIALYFANYLLNEDKWPLTDVLPAATHVVANLPLDDFNGTHTDLLLWVAGEIINDAWKFLDEDEARQRRYRDLIYNTYWPRIGSLWPLVHYDEFEFKDKVADKMFNDILSFVVCLNDLTERNPAFADYLKDYTPQKYYAHEMLRRKAFTESCKELSARERFNRTMAFEEDLAWFHLTYPEGIEEAKILLDEIFKKQNNKFTRLDRIFTLESLIITPNTMGVGEYILQYLDQHFDNLVELAHTPDNSDQTLVDLFIAMSKGVSEENEFPPLKSISEKLLARGADETKIKSALKYARNHRRAILFQRSALMKLF